MAPFRTLIQPIHTTYSHLLLRTHRLRLRVVAHDVVELAVHANVEDPTHLHHMMFMEYYYHCMNTI